MTRDTAATAPGLRLEHDPGGHAAGLDVLDRTVDVGQRAHVADDRRAARRVQGEPTTVMPLRTVSKIGSFTSLSAGGATKTSVPPRRSDAYARSNASGTTAGAIAWCTPPIFWIASTGSSVLVVEAHQRLDGTILNGVLASADPDLVAAWCAGPAGRDDQPAAELLLGLLPAGDERHPPLERGQSG